MAISRLELQPEQNLHTRPTLPKNDTTTRARQLFLAIQAANLRLVQEILADCDTRELFEKYSEYFRMPIICSAILALHHLDDGVYVRKSETTNVIIEELLEHGADVNESYFANLIQRLESPLTLAVSLRKLSLCKLLVDHGADVNSPCRSCASPKDFPVTPLSLAVESGSSFAAFFLAQGARFTVHNHVLSDCSHFYQKLVFPNLDIMAIFMDWCDRSQRRFPWEEALQAAFDKELEDNAMMILRRVYQFKDISLCSKFFEQAASKGMGKVMRYILEQQPQVMQSKWLKHGQIPWALKHLKDGQFV